MHISTPKNFRSSRVLHFTKKIIPVFRQKKHQKMMQSYSKQCKVEQIEGFEISERSSPPWSHLPQQILSKIAAFLELEGPSDKIRFQLVCKKWYDSCSSSSKHVLYDNLPLEIPIIPPILIQDKGPIFIVGTCVYLVQPLKQPSTQPWLVSVEELNLGKIRLHAPLTKKPIKDLPFNFPKDVDFSGFRVSLIHESLKICLENGCDDVVRLHEKGRWFDLAGRTKVILVTNDENLSDSCCVAIVLLIREGGTLMSFNLSNGGWRLLDFARGNRFDDIVCLKGSVYAIDRKGRLYPIDVDDNVAKVGDVTSNEICGGRAGGTRKRLVVLDEELHVIKRTRRKFDVYKLKRGRQWVEVNSLGDKILLVTLDDVFCVSARKFPACKGNCILFSKQCFPDYVGLCSFENQVFHRANKYLEVGVYYLGEDSSLPISCYPELCDMFWPFPSWICSDTLHAASSSRVVEEHQSNSSRLTALESSQDVAMPPNIRKASNTRTFHERIAKKGIPPWNNDDYVQAVYSIPQIHQSGSSTKTLHITCSQQVPKKSVPEIVDVDSIPDAVSLDKTTGNPVSLQRFEGVNVSSCFVPILKEVHKNHRNIIRGNVDEVKSDSLTLKHWLETLAQMVKIIQSDSVTSLSDSDAKFLDTALYDLQFMRFNKDVVNWLVPLVKGALDYHSEKNKQARKVQELESVRSNMLAELRELEERLAEEQKLAAQNPSVPPSLAVKKELR